MSPEVAKAVERPVDTPSRKVQNKISKGTASEDANSSRSSLSNEISNEAVNMSSSTPVPKILYRYIVKDEENIIVSKEESNEPIQYDNKIQITPPAKEVILEVVTTKTKDFISGRTTSEFETVLKIHSHYLLNALREIVSHYPGLNLYPANGIMEISDPFEPLVHHIDALNHYKTNQPEHHNLEMITTTNNHIDTLLGLLDGLMDDEVKIERDRHQRIPAVCTYENAWILFPPGSLVWIKQPNEDPKAAIVSYSTKGARLNTWGIKFDSDMHLQVGHAFYRMKHFEGEKEVSQLDICPKKWFTITPETVEKQMRRGKMYAELFRPCYKEYSGQVDDSGELHIHGKVMVDHNAWLAHKPLLSSKPYHPWDFDPNYDDPARLASQYIDINSIGGGCECESCREKARPPKVVPTKDWPHDPAKPNLLKDPVPEEFYLLCESKIGGYALNDRRWVSLRLDGISTPKIEDNPFDNLVLDQETKSTIEALVWNYALTDAKVQSWSTDFVKNKGEGRIFLLHGSPGVGKTCTAECVADLIGRPLLSLTCGDMGITASDVEKNFKEFIDLGERWGAVVLMDEADVYLEQRTSENLQRNSLVSVFLRTLEYFRGILFLTTNRVGAFDDAFISRIHVALHYKPLSDEYRKKIWEKNFRRLNNEGNITVDTATIIYAVSDADVIAVKWNGREIRNAVQTAVALAQFEARRAGRDNVVLEVEHLKRVVMMSKQFKDYITSTHRNQDETKRARIMESRNDEFSN